jgi:hypothetical protein
MPAVASAARMPVVVQPETPPVWALGVGQHHGAAAGRDISSAEPDHGAGAAGAGAAATGAVAAGTARGISGTIASRSARASSSFASSVR